MPENTLEMQHLDCEFAYWCVMTHARPVLVATLRAWHLADLADPIDRARSLSALRFTTTDADAEIRRRIGFDPLRRDLSHAVNTLHAAATFAARGDAENAAAVVIGVFTHAASAQTWHRPWTRLGWKRRRHDVIVSAQREQQLQQQRLRSDTAGACLP